ncbi:MAG: HAD hydrolase family protein, partial [Myxococcota bacterium]
TRAMRAVVFLLLVGCAQPVYSLRVPLTGHDFRLPQAFKNGVVIWDPKKNAYTHSWFLPQGMAEQSVEWLLEQGIAPFVFTIAPDGRHYAFHAPLRSPVDELMLRDFQARPDLTVLPLAELPPDARISNVSAIGEPGPIDRVAERARSTPGLVAYSSTAIESGELNWIDIHRVEASKGTAVDLLKRELGATRTIVFGDSYNDESMFEIADEAYAPENAKAPLRERATQVIGHHNDDGIAHFLRERFSLAS